MDAYVRVDKKKDDTPIQENEEKGHSSVQLKAMGRAINKTVTIAEILKRRVPGLHQITEIGSVDITDTWEPKEEGLNRLEITRHVSVMTVTLSTLPLDATNPGYQAPLPEEEIKPQQMEGEGVPPKRGRGRPRRGGRGGRGSGSQSGDVPADGSVPPTGEKRSGGRGRGRRQGRGAAAATPAAEGQHIGVVLAEQALPPAPALLPALPQAPL